MFVFGSSPKWFGQPQNSFVVVASSTCTSSPITVSHSVIVSSPSRPFARQSDDASG
jgi:hypothetical protein